jgi:hypothetical protein
MMQPAAQLRCVASDVLVLNKDGSELPFELEQWRSRRGDRCHGRGRCRSMAEVCAVIK